MAIRTNWRLVVFFSFFLSPFFFTGPIRIEQLFSPFDVRIFKDSYSFFQFFVFHFSSSVCLRCRGSDMSDSAADEEDEGDYMPTPAKAKAKPKGKGKATAAASKSAKPAAASKSSKGAKSKAVRK